MSDDKRVYLYDCTLRDGARPAESAPAETVSELVAGALHVRLDGLTAREVAHLIVGLGAAAYAGRVVGHVIGCQVLARVST